MKWLNTWSYTQQDYRSWPSEVENQVQIVRIQCNHYSETLKLRFSNEYGLTPIIFDYVKIRVIQEEAKQSSEIKNVTVCGNKQVFIYPTANLLSDEIALSLIPGTIIEIETMMRNKTLLTSGTVSYSRINTDVYNYQLKDGQLEAIEQKNLFRMVQENERMFYIYGLSGIDLLVENNMQLIVAFGDSLTQQGFWVDHLKKRFVEVGQHNVAVINRGIGGSRILKGQNPKNDAFIRHGNAGLNRFEKEIYQYGNPDTIIVLHGINDLISRHDGTEEYSYSLKQIEEGLMQYATIAKHHHSRIVIGTIPPMGKSIFYNHKFEEERRILNNWIRKSHYFDEVLDFDSALSDLKIPYLLDQDYDNGDGLHWSSEGGKRAAEIVDISKISMKTIHSKERIQ